MPVRFVKGNEAILQGAVLAGCRVFFGYPITPSSEIAESAAALMPAIGILAPFLWTGGKAQFWLAVPTSVFGFVLLPIAYSTFALVMNQKTLLGDDMPKGRAKIIWNVLMSLAAGLAAGVRLDNATSAFADVPMCLCLCGCHDRDLGKPCNRTVCLTR